MAKSLEERFRKSDEFILNVLKDSTNKIDKLVDNFFYIFKMYEKTGDKSYLLNDIRNDPRKELDPKVYLETIITSTVKRGRTNKKKILADITENNCETLNIKIKQEKLSIVSSASDESKATSLSCEENIDPKREEMPAPKQLPPRKRKIKTEPTDPPKRSTRTRRKIEKMEETSMYHETTSDVVIQNTTLVTVDITNDHDETSLNSREKSESEISTSVRNTRSKMRLKKQEDNNKIVNGAEPIKPVRSTRTKTLKRQKVIDSEDEKETEHSAEQIDKKSKSKSSTEQNKNEDVEANKTSQTEYEDAVSTLENENLGNTTYVMGKNETKQLTTQSDNNQNVKNKDVTFATGTMNSTYVLEKPNNVNGDTVALNNDNQHLDTNSPIAVKKKTKEIFSPYEKSSTKTKIEAFEKLGSKVETPLKKSNQIPVPKSKAYTPIGSKLFSTIKSNKKYSKCDTPISSNNVSMVCVKSHSALKASQAEFREREMRRQEKEREALKKRDAMLQALTETKKKKREEKMLKAQQQRELLEQENLKKMETQKMKQEKFEQLMAEKEERARQQREESEKKRLLVKKKAEELKERTKEKINETNSTEVMKSANKEKQRAFHNEQQKYRYECIPKYMVTPAPLLPTEDCYDSDDCQYQNTKYSRPNWSTDRVIGKTQLAMKATGEKIINTFFFRQIQTPNLQEIFETIDPKILKRTSSAVWKKPPRYTLFAETSHVCFSEEDDD